MQIKLTIDALAKPDDFSKRHCCLVLRRKMRQNTGTESNLFVQIGLCEAILAQFKLGRLDVFQVGIQDAQRVEVCNMVTADLVGANQQLCLITRYLSEADRGKHRRNFADLQMVIEFSTFSGVQRGGTAGRMRQESRRRLKSLLTWETFVHAGEVRIP